MAAHTQPVLPLVIHNADRPATRRRGLLLLLSAPSGTGKTTLARLLLAHDGRMDGSLQRSVSVTTRPQRPGEVNGKDYFFLTEDGFARMARQGELLETTELYGHRYGTPRAFEDQLGRGLDVLLILDARGRQQLAATHGPDLVSVFVLPPSGKELERRLRDRNQDSDQVIARRLAGAREEIADCERYDYVVVNRNLDITLEALSTILRAERLRRERPITLHWL